MTFLNQLTVAVNFLLFFFLFLFCALGALSGTGAVMQSIFSENKFPPLGAIGMIAVFYYLAWLSGRRAYRCVYGERQANPPEAVQKGFGMRWILLPLAFFAMIATLARPMFTDYTRKSREGALKGNLGAIRQALDNYAQDNGKRPTDVAELTAGGKYLNYIPAARVPNYHDSTSAVAVSDKSSDAGGYFYDPNLGKIRVNCTHTDTRGKSWDAY